MYLFKTGRSLFLWADNVYLISDGYVIAPQKAEQGSWLWAVQGKVAETFGSSQLFHRSCLLS